MIDLPWLDTIVQLTPVFATPVFGVIGSWIAYNQYRTNKDKLRLDLFEKRLEAYEKMQEYFRHVIREGAVPDEALALLTSARYKSLFLFDQDIVDYVNNTVEKAKEMRFIHLKIYGKKSLPIGQERNRLAHRKGELLTWHEEQIQDSPERYAKYLKFK